MSERLYYELCNWLVDVKMAYNYEGILPAGQFNKTALITLTKARDEWQKMVEAEDVPDEAA